MGLDGQKSILADSDEDTFRNILPIMSTFLARWVLQLIYCILVGGLDGLVMRKLPSICTSHVVFIIRIDGLSTRGRLILNRELWLILRVPRRRVMP